MVTGREVAEEVVAPVLEEAGLGDHPQAAQRQFPDEFLRDDGGVLDPVTRQRADLAEDGDEQDQRLTGHAVHGDRPAPCAADIRSTSSAYVGRPESASTILYGPAVRPGVAGSRAPSGTPSRCTRRGRSPARRASLMAAIA